MKKYLLLLVLFFPALFAFSQNADTIITEPLFTLSGHNDDVVAVAFSADGKTMVTGSWDRQVIFWDVATGQKLYGWEAHKSAILSINISRDGKSMLTVSNDGSATLWNVEKRTPLKSWHDREAPIIAATLSPDPAARMVALSHRNGHVKIYDRQEKMKMLRDMDLGGIQALAITYDNIGRYLFFGCSDNTIRHYDPIGQKELKYMEGHKNVINSLAVTVDGKKLISGSSDKTAIIWDTRTGNMEHKLTGHDWKVLSVALEPRSIYCITGSSDGTARIWKIEDGTLYATIEPEGKKVVNGVALSGDASLAAVVSRKNMETGNGAFVWKTGLNTTPQPKTPPQRRAVTPGDTTGKQPAPQGKNPRQGTPQTKPAGNTKSGSQPAQPGKVTIKQEPEKK